MRFNKILFFTIFHKNIIRFQEIFLILTKPDIKISENIIMILKEKNKFYLILKKLKLIITLN